MSAYQTLTFPRPGIPTWLLVRVMSGDGSEWRLWGRYRSEGEAERAWRREIKGRGVTAWSWWGPRVQAEQMLADPAWEPARKEMEG